MASIVQAEKKNKNSGGGMRVIRSLEMTAGLNKNVGLMQHVPLTSNSNSSSSMPMQMQGHIPSQFVMQGQMQQGQIQGQMQGQMQQGQIQVQQGQMQGQMHGQMQGQMQGHKSLPMGMQLQQLHIPVPSLSGPMSVQPKPMSVSLQLPTMPNPMALPMMQMPLSMQSSMHMANQQFNHGSLQAHGTQMRPSHQSTHQSSLQQNDLNNFRERPY